MAALPPPIVHIGYHKTATTWFQESVYPHAQGRRYLPRRAVQDALLAPSAFAFDAQAARDAIGDGAILCEENLSGYIHNGGLNGHLSRAMAKRIRETLPDARIVMFVRRQPAMIAACYLQYLRGGGTHRAHRYLFPQDYLHGASSEPWKAPRFGFDHFDYHKLAGHYRDLFGAERVHLYPYEALAADRRGFMRRFAADLDLKLDWDRVDWGGRNRSYNRAAAWAARGLNRLTARSVVDKRVWFHLPGFYSGRRWLLEQATRLPGARLTPAAVLGAQTVAWIEQRYWRSNAELAADWNLDLADHGYRTAPPNEPVDRPCAGGWRKAMAR